MTVEPRYLVPTNMGSVEHYFHFLLGYLCPISGWLDRDGRRRAIVRDCGPMNGWFDLLRPEADIEVVPPGTVLRQYVLHRSRCVVLPPLDNVALFHRDVLSPFTERVRRGAGPSPEGQAQVLVVDRRSSDPFHSSASSELMTSGSNRRSVPNMADVAGALEHEGACRLIDAAALQPRDQVHAFAAARVIVGQHGAGLANMVWMVPGSTVVEILPPMAPAVAEIFPRLAAACGLRYVRVRQEQLHAPVAVGDVVAAVGRAQDLAPESWSSGPLAGPRRAATRVRLRLRRQPAVDWLIDRAAR